MGAIWMLALTLAMLTGCRRHREEVIKDSSITDSRTLTGTTIERTDLRALTNRTQSDTLWDHARHTIATYDTLLVTLSATGDTIAIEKRRSVERLTDRDRGRSHADTGTSIEERATQKSDSTISIRTHEESKTQTARRDTTSRGKPKTWILLLIILAGVAYAILRGLYRDK